MGNYYFRLKTAVIIKTMMARTILKPGVIGVGVGSAGSDFFVGDGE